uniref:protein-ribulosamine 3-kinase n=1 Tax=Ascaris lumbricoides TaxID=6252 RepID=A0A9J2Q6C5_ASCLU
MEEVIKNELGLDSLESFGGSAGGCISRGGGYHTDKVGDVFIKFNDKQDAKRMFDGEFASLDAMYRTHTIRVPKPIKAKRMFDGEFASLDAMYRTHTIRVPKPIKAKRMFDGEFASLDAMYRTHTIRVPKPIKSISSGGRSCLVTEYISLNGPSKPAQLGKDLARMHIHNANLLAEKEHASGFVGGAEKGPTPVTQFGFDIPTCCGYLPQNNDWCDDWVARVHGNHSEKGPTPVTQFGFDIPTCCGYLPQNNDWCDDWVKRGDRELMSLWPQLERKIPEYFKDCGPIIPSILHGDLWSGNYAYCESGPVIFDPASFYGHSEYEMGIMTMFGGFGGAVYSAYHDVIPKQKGADKRIQLYELYHHLNHWNHFGGGYRGGSLSIMQSLS